MHLNFFKNERNSLHQMQTNDIRFSQNVHRTNLYGVKLQHFIYMDDQLGLLISNITKALNTKSKYIIIAVQTT